MWRERFKHIHQDLRELLNVLVLEFKSIGIEDWWISDGTLLGYYRDGKMIPWDDDMDIFIVIKDEKVIFTTSSQDFHSEGNNFKRSQFIH
jgi:phosphorylcholine metabolism protein LicD